MKYNLLGAVSTIALGAAFGVGTPGAANAALSCSGAYSSGFGTGSCTETVSFGPTKTDLSGAILTLDQWIAGQPGQTLLDVKYSGGGSLSTSGNVINTSPSSTATVNYNVNSEAFTFSPGANAPSNFLNPSIAPSIGFTQHLVGTLSPGASTGFNFSTSITPSAPILITTALNQYVGPGTFQALAMTHTSDGVSGNGGNINPVWTTLASPTFTITYDFSTAAPPPPPSPTPEPASLAVMGIGLAGMGALRRRRKS